MAKKDKVQKEADEAQKLWEQEYGKPGEESPAEEQAPAEPIEPPEETPPTLEDIAKQNEEFKKQLDTMDQRHRVLQSKYDAEIPRYATYVKVLEESLKEREKAASTVTPREPEDPVLTKFREDYPMEDEVIEKKIAKAMAQIDQKIQEQSSKAIEPIVRQTAQTAEERFWENFYQNHSEWENLRVDPNFNQWLSGQDPMTGNTRNELFVAAYNRKDARVASNIVTAYKESIGQPANPPAPAGAPPAPHVAPTQAGRTSQTRPNLETFTKEAVRQFYQDMMRGRLDMTPKEAKDMEKKIEKAMQQGRIVD